MEITVPSRFQGPPTMGHGGYVAGFFANRTPGAVQVTLKRPIPLDRPLELTEVDDDRWVLTSGDDVVAQSEPADLHLEVPTPPTLDTARAAEAGSPSFYDDRGVHPTCFGCGNLREEGDGLRIFVGPVEVDGVRQVAGVWRPGAAFAEADHTVSSQIVLAALDCPGAFAFIVDETRAGLLGRIVFEQHGVIRADADHIVSGWQAGRDGRKLFAGTAVFSADGALLAAAYATWFQMTVVG